MYTQTDVRWKHILMTGPKDLPNASEGEIKKRWQLNNNGLRGDTLGRWGCYVTALTNARNYRIKDLKLNMPPYTPETANQALRDVKGYQILAEGKYCPVGQESFLLEDGIKKAFGISEIIYNFTGVVDINDPDYYYVCRVPFSPPKIMSGHYCLLVGNKTSISYHDSDTGVIRNDWEYNNNYWITRVKFNV